MKKSTTVRKARVKPRGLNNNRVPTNKAAHGRPSNDLRLACRDQLWKRRGIAFLGKVMAGLVTETVPMSVSLGGTLGSEVRLVEVPVKVKDRLAAADMLMDRGYGKPEQHMSVEDQTPRPTGEQLMGRILELLPKVIASLPVDRKEIARLLAERRRVEVLVQGREIAK